MVKRQTDKDQYDDAPKVERWVTARPDPSILEVITSSPYPLPNAIAELVDNSLDAGASDISIRFLRDTTRAIGLAVIDNGRGIAADDFDRAMTFASKSKHKSTDIGMFGVGLKSASLSQAEDLRVYSKTSTGSARARQWKFSELKNERLAVLSDQEAVRHYSTVANNSPNFDIARHGTIVEWFTVRDMHRSISDPEAYLKAASLDVSSHLGLCFHRFIESGRLSIHIEVEQENQIVHTQRVAAINPFKYPRSGLQGWPKPFRILVSDPVTPQRQISILANAHIWPPRTQLPEYKIRRIGGRRNTIDNQGLYFYLNDRLVMAGGWANVRTAEAHIALARMEISLDTDLLKVIEPSYTKDAVRIPASLTESIRNSKSDDNTTFSQWVDLAQEVFRTGSDKSRLPSIPIPQGTQHRIAQRLIRESDFPDGEQVAITWQALPIEDLFQVDREKKRIVLNARWKKAIHAQFATPQSRALLEFLLLFALRDHFGERSTRRVVEAEDLFNQYLKEMMK